MSNKKIALIGLGYVGLPLAVEFGKKRVVVGFDINQPRINDLKNGVDSRLVNIKTNNSAFFSKFYCKGKAYVTKTN